MASTTSRVRTSADAADLEGDLLPEIRVLDTRCPTTAANTGQDPPGEGDAVLERHLSGTEEQDKSATLEDFGLAGTWLRGIG
jgi:hypothetical protein